MKELRKLLENIWAVPKNRRMGILFLIFMTGFYILLMQGPTIKQEVAATQVEVSTQKDKVKNTIVQAVDRNEHTLMQDPFAAPRSFHERGEMLTEKETKVVVQSQKVFPAVTPTKMTKLPIVTGILGSGNRFVAILEYGKISKQCVVEDSIGPYQVIGIDEKNVIINGPSGAVNLAVGR